MVRDRLLIAVVVWAIFSACNGCLGCLSPVDQPGSNLPGTCQAEAPVVDAQKLDVLFVVDNSDSMREEQEGVARELTSFVSELRSAGGVQQDIRVGVITTSVYEHVIDSTGHDYFLECDNYPPYCSQQGKLQAVPDSAPDGGVILGTGSERVLDNNDPDLVEKFSRLVRVGIYGSGQETPFEALRLAFSTPLSTTPIAMGGNSDFLRDGARLLIVVLSDEDDCSENFVRPSKVTIGPDPTIDYCGNQGNFLTPVQDYHDLFLSQIKDSKGELKDIVYAAIAPVGIDTKVAMAILSPQVTADGGTYQTLRNIDCPTSNGPGIRHRKMAELFDSTLANLDSICRPSYHDTLENIAALAGVSQVLEVGGIPDPGVVKVVITRRDNTTQNCSVANGGLTIEPPTSTMPKSRVHFTNTCLRRRDDLSLMVSLLCAY
jgi:hypothetical protein